MDKKILAFDLGGEVAGECSAFLMAESSDSKLSIGFPTARFGRWIPCTGMCCGSTAKCWPPCVAVLRTTGEIASLGVEHLGWCDFGLLGRGGALLGHPRHYRDPHTEGIMGGGLRQVSREESSVRPGCSSCALIPFSNSSLSNEIALLCWIWPRICSSCPTCFITFSRASRSPSSPTPRRASFTIATHKRWAYGLVKAFDLPGKILGTIVNPGTVLGPLRTSVAVGNRRETIQVIAPPRMTRGRLSPPFRLRAVFGFALDAHSDSERPASAKRQAPLQSNDCALISSGTLVPNGRRG